MRKIALINSNTPFLLNERTFPNIGLLRVATQLDYEKNLVDVLDYAGWKQEEIEKDIRRRAYNYDYYGFSSTSPQFPYTMKIFNYLKNENPHAKTILGGPHASALYNLKQKGIDDINITDLECFDTIFAGEGENTTNMFKPGWQKGEIIKDIDKTFIPDRDFINLKSYNYNLFGDKTTCLMTQRGCPNQCEFCCGRDIEMYNRTRVHSPERVINEMDKLHNEYGYSSFMLYDDEVNMNINRLEKLCSELKNKKYKLRGFVRSDMICKYPESVQWLKDAGFVKLCTGVESGSNRMLKNIKKGVTVEQNTLACKLIKDAGIHYEAFMMIGFPDETKEDVEMTRKWLLENKPNDFDLGIITPYPGSKIYDNAEKIKRFKNYEFHYNGMYFNKPRYSTDDSFYRGFMRVSKSDVRTNSLTNKQILKLRNSIDKEVRECLKIK